ncbi:MAG TPA: hypothetical protein VMN58_08285 [Acidimicrobiales bacterium]|nr:hypothetical protein [Acidimicrobiales bacterium]
MTIGRRLAAALIAAAVLLAACGGDTSVGSDELRSFEEQEAGEGRLGETTTTAVDLGSGPLSEEATPDTAPPETAPPATTAPPPPPPPTTAPVDNAAITIAIRSDDFSPQFNPSVARVFAGSVVRWVNEDSEVRSVNAGDGSFASGDIAPGGTFERRFDQPGIFDYRDGTRPYVTARLEVLE